jgi:hypothetical protein
MNTTVSYTPFSLIPKQLFKEEKIIEYFNFLVHKPANENVGKEELENYYLIYPKQKEEDSIHVISLMFNNILEKNPEPSHLICINAHEDFLHLLCIKEHKIEFAGFFHFSVKEDVVYHVANVYQQYYENIFPVDFYYLQLTPDVLRLLDNYFEMKKL